MRDKLKQQINTVKSIYPTQYTIMGRGKILAQSPRNESGIEGRQDWGSLNFKDSVAPGGRWRLLGPTGWHSFIDGNSSPQSILVPVWLVVWNCLDIA